MQNEVRVLTAIYLASALNSVLDDITVYNKPVQDFKRHTNTYLRFLEKNIHKHLNDSYSIDPELFEILDKSIHNNAKDFKKEILDGLLKCLK